MAREPAAANALPNLPASAAWLWRHRVPIGIASIVLVSFLVYFPALRGGFLWDDEALLTDNPLIRASDGLYRIWFTSQPVDYWPVSNSTLWFEWRLWGMDTTGYHVTNVLLHILTSLLVWAVLRELRTPGAFLGALLFAVHPVNVESVAWIAQRKTVMATMFGLLCILAYARALRADDRQAVRATCGWYALSWLAFVLGMLSKASIATLPLVLLGCAWWLRGRITLRDVGWTVPFLLIAVPLVFVNMWFQTHGVEAVLRHVTPLERLLGAGAVPWFYLHKALVPLHLVFIYPQWHLEAMNPLWWLPLLSCIGVTIGLWRYRSRRWGRGLLFAWFCFLVMLLPVMGFTDVIFMAWSLVADHYQYSAIVAVLAVVAAGLTLWRQQARDEVRMLSTAVPPLLVGALGLLSWQQSKLYLNAEQHWRTTIELNPTHYVAYNNLGNVLMKQQRSAEAVTMIEQSLRLEPNNPEAKVNMGMALSNLGRSTEAINHFEQALRLRPQYPLAECNLGGLLINLNRPQEAIAHLERALEQKPEYADAESNLGMALFLLGRPQEATKHFERALQFSSRDAQARMRLAHSLYEVGQYEAALDQFAEAARLDPENPDARLGMARAHSKLASMLATEGQTAAALEHYGRALEHQPDLAEVHNDLACTLANAGRSREAVEHFERAWQLTPQDAGIETNLAAALLNSNRPQEAISHFEHALQRNPDYLLAWTNLATARAQLGQTEQAIAAIEQALPRARAQNQTALTEQLETILQTLRAEPATPSSTVTPVPGPALPP